VIRKIVLWLGVVVGIVGHLGAVFWCMMAAAWGAASDIQKAGLFLVMGPLLVLPASILAFWAPRISGTLLIVGGLFSAVWHILVSQSPMGWSSSSGASPPWRPGSLWRSCLFPWCDPGGGFSVPAPGTLGRSSEVTHSSANS
jgi:hypothetical protein